MNTLVLKETSKPLYQVQPQHSHPKVSLRRVLYVRFLRWIDKASFEAIKKALMRVSTLLAVSLAYFLPHFFMGLMTSAMQWNGYKIPIFCVGLAMTLNAKRCWLWMRRSAFKRRGSNQYTFHGLPVGELASFLKEHGAFKREEAITRLALSQGQYAKIAKALEKHGVLCRGENNARVLRDITLEQLVRQLKEDFPLVYDSERKLWIERDGPFDSWVLSKEFAKKKVDETTERRERKIERLDQKIADRTRTFHTLFSPQTGL